MHLVGNATVEPSDELAVVPHTELQCAPWRETPARIRAQSALWLYRIDIMRRRALLKRKRNYFSTGVWAEVKAAHAKESAATMAVYERRPSHWRE